MPYRFKDLIAAIQFLTVLPVGSARHFDPVAMRPFFPVVGVVVGCILALADAVFCRLWQPSIAALLDVVVLIVLTAAFHLDGLADTADGLFSHRPKERVLEIMKDSRIGVMGAVAILCILAVKWAGLAALSTDRALILVVVPAYARTGMLIAIKTLPYARVEGGTGTDFFAAPVSNRDLSWILLPLGLSVVLGWSGVVLALVAAGLTAVLIRFYKHKLGGVTGDMLGALCETTEAVLFLTAAAVV